MEAVARIERPAQACRIGGIAHDRVEIHHRVEMAGCADPGVERQAIGLAGGVRAIFRAAEGQYGGADHLDARERARSIIRP